jgi:hypothetical protein
VAAGRAEEEESDTVPTLPGVILARDGGARSIDDDLPDAVLQVLKAAGDAEGVVSDKALMLELSKGQPNLGGKAGAWAGAYIYEHKDQIGGFLQGARNFFGGG